MAYSYACADCEGMEACPGKVVAETEDEVWHTKNGVRSQFLLILEKIGI